MKIWMCENYTLFKKIYSSEFYYYFWTFLMFVLAYIWLRADLEKHSDVCVRPLSQMDLVALRNAKVN